MDSAPVITGSQGSGIKETLSRVVPTTIHVFFFFLVFLLLLPTTFFFFVKISCFQRIKLIMSNESNDNTILLSLEKPLAYLISLVLSRQEYQSILKNQTFIDTVNLPDPNLVDPDVSSAIDEGHTIPKLVRSNTRLLVKLYCSIISVQNFRAFSERQNGGKLNLHFFDSSIAKSAATLAGISLSYKICYKALIELEPVVTTIVKTFIETNISSSENQPPPSLQPGLKYQWKIKTIIAILSAISSGSLFKNFSNDSMRDILSIYVLLRGLEALYLHLVNLGVLKPKNVGLKWPLFQLAFSELFHSLIYAEVGEKKSAINKLLFFFTDGVLPVRKLIVINKPEIRDWISDDLYEPSWYHFMAKLFLKKYITIGKYVFLIYLLKALFFSSPMSKVTANKKDKNESETESVVGEEQESMLYFKTVEVLKSIKKTFQTTNFLVLPTFTALTLLQYANYGALGGLNESLKVRLIGFISGLWAVLSIPSFGSIFVRSALLLKWRKLSGEVKEMKRVENYLFVIGFTLLLGVLEKDPAAITGSTIRKILCWIKTDEYIDPVVKDN